MWLQTFSEKCIKPFQKGTVILSWNTADKMGLTLSHLVSCYYAVMLWCLWLPGKPLPVYFKVYWDRSRKQSQSEMENTDTKGKEDLNWCSIQMILCSFFAFAFYSSAKQKNSPKEQKHTESFPDVSRIGNSEKVHWDYEEGFQDLLKPYRQNSCSGRSPLPLLSSVGVSLVPSEPHE